MWWLIYNGLILPLARLLVRIGSISNKKIKQSVQAKRGLWKRLESKIQSRDQSRPLIWFHAPSVGEYLLAQPVIENLLKANVDCLVTYNSVSMVNWLEKTTGEFENRLIGIDSMPIDSLSNVKKWYRLIGPSAVIFVAYDLWPNMIWRADKMNIPLFLLSATIKPSSLRYKSAVARSLYKSLYKKFTSIFAITEKERERFLRTDRRLNNIEILGNTKFESALDRRDRLPDPTLPSFFKKRRIFIAGSTWPPDEACLFPSIETALNQFSDLMVIIAPHEPTEEHLSRTETFFSFRQVFRYTKLDPENASPFDILLIDTIGVLSALYKQSDIAYVGGGFTTGVHNVLEPTVNGLPTLFGPRYQNAAEAIQLTEKQLSFSVSDSDEITAVLTRLLENKDQTAKLGKEIRAFVEQQRGAAEKGTQRILNGIRTPTEI